MPSSPYRIRRATSSYGFVAFDSTAKVTNAVFADEGPAFLAI